MAEEDLTLPLGRRGVRGRVRFSKFEIGFDINVGSLLQVAKVVVRRRTEREDSVPGRKRLRASWKKCWRYTLRS